MTEPNSQSANHKNGTNRSATELGDSKGVELRPLVQIEHHNIALTFCHYLNSEHIHAQLKANDQQEQRVYVIYCQADKLEQAAQLFSVFITEPTHPKYQKNAWQRAETVEMESQDSLLLIFKQKFLSHAGIVTLTMFALCWLVFLASLLGYAQPVYQKLQFFFSLNLTSLLSEPYRLIGPALFHFSWLHIVFNTLWWWQLGGDIEDKIGKLELVNLFLITAIVSNLGQFLVSGPNFGGLSGVVYGLVGYCWWLGWLAPKSGIQLARPIIGIMLVWMMLGFANLLPVNMANTAHLLGLLSGCGLAYIRAKFR